MKKYITLLFTLIATNAHAEDLSNFYLKSYFGYNYTANQSINQANISTKLKESNKLNDLSVGVGFGYNINDSTRLEIVYENIPIRQIETSRAFKYTIYKIDTSTKFNNFLGNIITYCPLNNKFTVFAGVGLGTTYAQKSSIGYSNQRDIVKIQHTNYSPRMIYKGFVGVEYSLSNKSRIELAYNYYNLGKDDLYRFNGMPNRKTTNLYTHNVSLGSRLYL